ncbi:flagellin [Paenibacillus baekrokdamisoli]|uniref:Flagellin n=1 Tax=Paenibacillus baekrokdamisoli TaxID=1712516 RepID=A0A3G9JG04_9BACL|nr:flagellin [Paenibacillus baekrokdamisoli]MBB3069099.1 flagellin [Paenibacillus baekrokdamisoli]BBH23913.1 flagellin [Paenibacillus baekrokdamisoli]
MIINHNLNAMNAHRNLAFNNTQQGKSSEKLSSGYRINRAADDAAGLSISEKMRAQIKSLSQAQRNTQDGISLVQTAEGAMNEVSDMLTRMKELATQAGNGTYNSTDITAMNNEYQKLASSITNDITANTKFNGITLLKATAAITIQTGDNIGDQVSIDLTKADISGLSFGTLDSTGAEMAKVDTAIETVNTGRSELGAVQNQLEHRYNNTASTTENLQAAESRIRDTDMASEMMTYSKFNILQQAATAMLAQANQAPQGVLQLLR